MKLTPLRTQPCCPRCMKISRRPPASARSPGESGAIRQARTYLLTRDRLDRDSVVTRGYWRFGAVNHPDYDDGTNLVDNS